MLFQSFYLIHFISFIHTKYSAMPGIIGFWKVDEDYGWLSQWWKSDFVIDKVRYVCGEQYMMAQKALLFKDLDTYDKIMGTNNQQKMKQLGRMVKGFDEKTWIKNREQIVYDANYAKFSQNKELKDQLLLTREKELVEASPYDCIWGIGVTVHDKRFKKPHLWKGQNLLGNALMHVRAELKAELEMDEGESKEGCM